MAARTGTGSAERILGAVLPDLAPMAGLRTPREALSPEVAGGVACHRRADASFHADPTFVAGAARLRRAARDGGLAEGPSRAVGHAGWELLLDGALLGRSEAAGVFARGLAAGAGIAGAFGDGSGRWLGLLARLEHDRWWRRYDDDAVVASALWRRLRTRRRLAFDEAALPSVAAVLGAARASVAATAGAVVDRAVEVERSAAPMGGAA